MSNCVLFVPCWYPFSISTWTIYFQKQEDGYFELSSDLVAFYDAWENIVDKSNEPMVFVRGVSPFFSRSSKDPSSLITKFYS
jgi:hypothetical protein